MPSLSDLLSQTWPARAGRSLADAFMLPGDVYAGRIDPLSEKGLGRAADLAGGIMGGSFGAARGATLGSGPVRGTFYDTIKTPINPGISGIESIVSPAVRIGDQVYTGSMHADAFAKAVNAGHPENAAMNSGFLTSSGKFVDREEAARIASAARQTSKKSLSNLGTEDIRDVSPPALVPETGGIGIEIQRLLRGGR